MRRILALERLGITVSLVALGACRPSPIEDPSLQVAVAAAVFRERFAIREIGGVPICIAVPNPLSTRGGPPTAAEARRPAYVEAPAAVVDTLRAQGYPVATAEECSGTGVRFRRKTLWIYLTKEPRDSLVIRTDLVASGSHFLGYTCTAIRRSAAWHARCPIPNFGHY